MDLSLVAATSSAISAAREIGKAAMGLRDFNQLAVVVSQLNEQILKAQDALFSHQAQLIALQQDLMDTKERLRLAEKVVEDRGRYLLFELSAGVFVYRSKSVQVDASTESAHMLCQPCFDAGRKSVLQRTECSVSVSHFCPLCKTEFLEVGCRDDPASPGPKYPFSSSYGRAECQRKG